MLSASLALLIAVAPSASATSVARLSAELATDTEHLAESREELVDVRERQVTARREHRRLRREVEDRLVSIYKHGTASQALTVIAGSASVRDMGTSIDAVDVVTEHEAKSLRRFQALSVQLVKLRGKRVDLLDDIEDAEADVRRGRARLDRATAALERARIEAAKMAQTPDSPLLPRVGHPENTSLAIADSSSISNSQPVGFTQSGIASFYADSFTGELTANGERYDPNAFTAAHPSLPFGTWVNVRGSNGSIAVRINDRGPFVGGRIIDLSRAAAAAIGLPGIGPVTLTVSA